MKRLAHLEKSQWWPHDQIVEQQAVHIRQLVEHGYAHVPYYRDRMNERGLQPVDIRTIEDLGKLPP
ncbi:MAG: phenylacetate--CoA ligase family protein, partial [Armatimonadetes bacterium]|nr:phenylacetate--CoA ligase family protein [Armatimonadota bacterium]